MEHKLIQGGEQYLPFARSRIKALRALGLAHASQQFEIAGATVKVRIDGENEYISLEEQRGGAFLVFRANQSSADLWNCTYENIVVSFTPSSAKGFKKIAVHAGKLLTTNWSAPGYTAREVSRDEISYTYLGGLKSSVVYTVATTTRRVTADQPWVYSWPPPATKNTTTVIMHGKKVVASGEETYSFAIQTYYLWKDSQTVGTGRTSGEGTVLPPVQDGWTRALLVRPSGSVSETNSTATLPLTMTWNLAYGIAFSAATTRTTTYIPGDWFVDYSSSVVQSTDMQVFASIDLIPSGLAAERKANVSLFNSSSSNVYLDNTAGPIKRESVDLLHRRVWYGGLQVLRCCKLGFYTSTGSGISYWTYDRSIDNEAVPAFAPHNIPSGVMTDPEKRIYFDDFIVRVVLSIGHPAPNPSAGALSECATVIIVNERKTGDEVAAVAITALPLDEMASSLNLTQTKASGAFRFKRITIGGVPGNSQLVDILRDESLCV